MPIFLWSTVLSQSRQPLPGFGLVNTPKGLAVAVGVLCAAERAVGVVDTVVGAADVGVVDTVSDFNILVFPT